MIYLDNAATTYPKPKRVIDAMVDYMQNCGASPSRGSYSLAIKASRCLYDSRKKVAKLFRIDDVSRVVFTKNSTESINIALKGLLKNGDHVITTSLEHNSVYRCLNRLKTTEEIDITLIWADERGIVDSEQFEKNIRPNTKAFVYTHASNLIGNILPIKEIGEIAKKYGIITIIDASQTAGHIDINVKDDNIDVLCFTGHKGLYGPQGIGGLYISPKIDIVPLIEGGTGGDSNKPLNPESYPDKLEAGTINMPGVVGLSSGIDFINSVGIEKIRGHEQHLLELAYEMLGKNPQVKIYGNEDISKKVGIFSFNVKGVSSADVGYLLDNRFSIITRTGLHCTPLAHKTIGTINEGAVRCSFSYFNKESDIIRLSEAICKIGKGEI